MTESAGHPAGTVQQITGSGARWRGWGCSQRRGLQHRDGASPAHPLPSCVAETALPVSGNPILQHLGSSPSTSEAFPQQLCQRRLCPHSSRALKCPPVFHVCRSHLASGESAFFISLSTGPRARSTSTNHQLLQYLFSFQYDYVQASGAILLQRRVQDWTCPGPSCFTERGHTGWAGALCFTGASLGWVVGTGSSQPRLTRLSVPLQEGTPSLLAAHWPLGLCDLSPAPCGRHLHSQASGHPYESHVHLPFPREEGR